MAMSATVVVGNWYFAALASSQNHDSYWASTGLIANMSFGVGSGANSA
jgi:hypothetical protein